MEQGHQREQVKNMLEETDKLTVHMNDEERALSVQPQLYKALVEEIQTLTEQNKQLIESLSFIHERMNGYEALFVELQDYTREQVYEKKGQRDNERKRDEYLMRVMNDLQGKREGNVSTKEKKKLFTKFFKK